jgi:hypothetical protein
MPDLNRKTGIAGVMSDGQLRRLVERHAPRQRLPLVKLLSHRSKVFAREVERVRAQQQMHWWLFRLECLDNRKRAFCRIVALRSVRVKQGITLLAQCFGKLAEKAGVPVSRGTLIGRTGRAWSPARGVHRPRDADTCIGH